MQVKAAIVEVIRNFEITLEEQTPEELTIGTMEFMGRPDCKVLLKFKEI